MQVFLPDKIISLKPVLSFWSVFIVLFSGFDFSYASDFSRELAYQQVMQNLQVGELVSLDAGGRKFVGLYAEAQKNPNENAVLILHDMGAYPDQQPVVRALRSEFPEHHWASLSLQMPIRESGSGVEDYYALFPDAALRIQAGIDFLVKNELKNIAVVGYGLGGLMALYAVAEKNLSVKALVAVSLAVPTTNHPAAQTPAMLKKIKLPLLDVYAERDAENVRESARDRRLASKKNTAYRQLRLAGEDHSYQHENGLLVKRIYSWLSREAAMTDGR